MQLTNSLFSRVLVKGQRAWVLLASLLATFWTRLVVLAVATGLLLSLLYGQAWSRFIREPELPIGITPTNPELNASLLQDINTQRTERTDTTPPDFRRFSPLFAPQPPPR